MSSSSAFLRYLKPFSPQDLSATAERWKGWGPGDAPLDPLERVSPHVVGVVKKGVVHQWEFAHPLVMLLRTQNSAAIEEFWDPQPFSPTSPIQSPDTIGTKALSDFGHWKVWEEAFACDSPEPLKRLLALAPLSRTPHHLREDRWGQKCDPWNGFGAAAGLSDDEVAARLEWVLGQLPSPASVAQDRQLLHNALMGAAGLGLADRALLLTERFGLTEVLEPALLLAGAGHLSGAWTLLQRSPGFSLEGKIDLSRALNERTWDVPHVASLWTQVLTQYHRFNQQAMAKRVPGADTIRHQEAFRALGTWLVGSVVATRWVRRNAGYTDAPFHLSNPEMVRLMLILGPSVFSMPKLKEPRVGGAVLGEVLKSPTNNQAILSAWLPHITPALVTEAIRNMSEPGKQDSALQKIQFSVKKAEQPAAYGALLAEWVRPLKGVPGVDWVDCFAQLGKALDVPEWETYRAQLRAEDLDHALPSASGPGWKPRF